MSEINAESTTMPPVELRMPRASERVFANFNFTVLDCCPVTIGDDVLFGPNVSLLPPMHPLRWQDRNVRQAPDGSAYDCEYGKPIVIVAAAAPRLWLLLGEEIAVSAGPIFAGGGGGETCGLGIGH